MDKNSNSNTNEFKNPTFFKALKNSLRGIFLSVTTERNIKIQLVFAIIATICGVIFKISMIEWICLVVTIFLVLITESLNTAIEKTVDMITNEYNENAKNIKDISAGAVLFSAMSSVIVGLMIFLPKFLEYIL